MVKVLLPKAALKTADSTDALAIAITHAHHRGAKSLAAALARS
jgi:crossover junction endodeoxyribonuclease RuvC